MITDDMRAKMQAINANLSHTRAKKPGARYYRHDGEKVVEHERPSAVTGHSMFPYKSTSMAVDPSEVPEVQERLRRQGLFTEFDTEGRPVITSTKQHSDLAKALGMKTGRDGFGHTDQFGNFQNSGRRRNDEVQEGRGRVRRAIQELEAMPEEVPAYKVNDVLDEYDIIQRRKTRGNTIRNTKRVRWPPHSLLAKPLRSHVGGSMGLFSWCCTERLTNAKRRRRTYRITNFPGNPGLL